MVGRGTEDVKRWLQYVSLPYACIFLVKKRRGDLQMHEAKAITEFRNSCLKRLLTVNSEIRNDPDVYFHVAAFVSLLVIAVVILPGRRESSCLGALAGHVCKSKCALVSATASFSVTMDPNGRGRQFHAHPKLLERGKQPTGQNHRYPHFLAICACISI